MSRNCIVYTVTENMGCFGSFSNSIESSKLAISYINHQNAHTPWTSASQMHTFSHGLCMCVSNHIFPLGPNKKNYTHHVFMQWLVNMRPALLLKRNLSTFSKFPYNVLAKWGKKKSLLKIHWFLCSKSYMNANPCGTYSRTGFNMLGGETMAVFWFPVLSIHYMA